MSAYLYVEGGGDSSSLRRLCREGFAKLLSKSGFKGRMPNIIAKGGRGAAYEAFKFRHLKRRAGDFVAMMIDSEEPLAQLEATWPHLKQRDQWARPAGAIDDQVLFMTTCMETWIVSDRVSLKKHFGQHLKEKGLAPLDGLENRGRHDVQDALIKATRSCPNAYQKGERSYAILGELDPAALKEHLPSFRRAVRILEARL